VTADVHFVQGGDEPVLAGAGTGTLSCACGNTLVTGYDPGFILGIGIQCARCATVTTTQQLPGRTMLPSAVIMAEPSATPRIEAMTVPPGFTVIGRAEIERVRELFRPVTPPSNIYQFSTQRLDEAVAAYEDHVGSALPPVIEAEPNDPFRGLQVHALAWAIGYLRTRMRAESWACTEDHPTAAAAVQVAGFLHFVATWAHHPLFPAMAATAAEHGCSLHGLAPYAAAHALTMLGNLTSFPAPTGYPGRIEGLNLVTGPGETLAVQVDIFDRFEYPFGRPWDHARLRSAVAETIEAVQGRINLRNPGLFLLSPGITLAGFDEALIQAINHAMLTLGRKNRGLMAVAPIVLRLLPTADPHAIQFGYGLFPVTNRHYRGTNQLRTPG
jgi:hypothetical protein